MHASSAFDAPLRSDTLIRISPPVSHLVSYVTGGYGELFKNIKQPQRLNVKPYGTYTGEGGCFVPEEGMSLLAGRYRYVDVIGSGQSSVLIKAQDTFFKDELVSIKVLHRHYSQLGAQETDCVRRLNQADPHNISGTVRLLTVFAFDDHYCMVFELLHPKPLLQYSFHTRDQCVSKLKTIAMHFLKPLGFLHQQNIIHADLKPENILLKQEDDMASLKLVDFGNALRCVHDELSLYYEDFELQTLLYRAPEVMFGLSFDLAVDMWSFGCIIAELYLGKPLFYGTNKLSVVKKMVKLMGPLPRSIFQRGKFFRHLALFTSDSSQIDATVSILEKLKLMDYQLASFIAACLRYDPGERMTPLEAARHPFLAEFGLAFLTPLATQDSHRLKAMVPTKSEYPLSPAVEYSRACTMSSVDVLRNGGTGDYLARIRPEVHGCQAYPIVVTPRNRHHHIAKTPLSVASTTPMSPTPERASSPNLSSASDNIAQRLTLSRRDSCDVAACHTSLPDQHDDASVTSAPHVYDSTRQQHTFSSPHISNVNNRDSLSFYGGDNSGTYRTHDSVPSANPSAITAASKPAPLLLDSSPNLQNNAQVPTSHPCVQSHQDTHIHIAQTNDQMHTDLQDASLYSGHTLYTHTYNGSQLPSINAQSHGERLLGRKEQLTYISERSGRECPQQSAERILPSHAGCVSPDSPVHSDSCHGNSPGEETSAPEESDTALHGSSDDNDTDHVTSELDQVSSADEANPPASIPLEKTTPEYNSERKCSTQPLTFTGPSGGKGRVEAEDSTRYMSNIPQKASRQMPDCTSLASVPGLRNQPIRVEETGADVSDPHEKHGHSVAQHVKHENQHGRHDKQQRVKDASGRISPVAPGDRCASRPDHYANRPDHYANRPDHYANQSYSCANRHGRYVNQCANEAQLQDQYADRPGMMQSQHVDGHRLEKNCGQRANENRIDQRYTEGGSRDVHQMKKASNPGMQIWNKEVISGYSTGVHPPLNKIKTENVDANYGDGNDGDSWDSKSGSQPAVSSGGGHAAKKAVSTLDRPNVGSYLESRPGVQVPVKSETVQNGTEKIADVSDGHFDNEGAQGTLSYNIWNKCGEETEREKFIREASHAQNFKLDIELDGALQREPMKRKERQLAHERKCKASSLNETFVVGVRESTVGDLAVKRSKTSPREYLQSGNAVTFDMVERVELDQKRIGPGKKPSGKYSRSTSRGKQPSGNYSRSMSRKAGPGDIPATADGSGENVESHRAVVTGRSHKKHSRENSASVLSRKSNLAVSGEVPRAVHRHLNNGYLPEAEEGQGHIAGGRCDPETKRRVQGAGPRAVTLQATRRIQDIIAVEAVPNEEFLKQFENPTTEVRCRGGERDPDVSNVTLKKGRKKLTKTASKAEEMMKQKMGKGGNRAVRKRQAGAGSCHVTLAQADDLPKKRKRARNIQEDKNYADAASRGKAKVAKTKAAMGKERQNRPRGNRKVQINDCPVSKSTPFCKFNKSDGAFEPVSAETPYCSDRSRQYLNADVLHSDSSVESDASGQVRHSASFSLTASWDCGQDKEPGWDLEPGEDDEGGSGDSCDENNVVENDNRSSQNASGEDEDEVILL